MPTYNHKHLNVFIADALFAETYDISASVEAHRRNRSLLTHRWRKTDSNPRSLSEGSAGTVEHLDEVRPFFRGD
jgi:hypothetical protein